MGVLDHHELIEQEDGTAVVVSVPPSTKEYIKARIEGSSDFQAMQKAGTYPSQVEKRYKDGTITTFFRERLKEAGLGDEITIETLRNALHATKYVNVTRETVRGSGAKADRFKSVRSVKVADHAIRLEALHTKLELAGEIGRGADYEQGTVTNNTVNIITDNQLNVSDPKEILKDMVSRARAFKQNRVYDRETTEVQEMVNGNAEPPDSRYDGFVPGNRRDPQQPTYLPSPGNIEPDPFAD